MSLYRVCASFQIGVPGDEMRRDLISRSCIGAFIPVSFSGMCEFRKRSQCSAPEDTRKHCFALGYAKEGFDTREEEYYQECVNDCHQGGGESVTDWS